MKLSRTLLLLANLARAVPVNPLMLIDTTHHAAGSDGANEVVATHPVLSQPADNGVVEAQAKNAGASQG